MKKSILSIATLFLAAAFLFTGCEDKKETVDAHDDAYTLEVSYTPNPATVNTEISFTYKVEDEHNEHVGGLMHTESEFEMTGMGPVEMELTEDSADEGHYLGTATFSMAGEYEVHFEYMHGDESSHMSASTTFIVQ